MGDVRNDIDSWKKYFRVFKPELVYHAAAYKHVPMMENNPSESILTNVLGTKVCVDLSGKIWSEKLCSGIDRQGS